MYKGIYQYTKGIYLNETPKEGSHLLYKLCLEEYILHPQYITNPGSPFSGLLYAYSDELLL